MSCYSIKGQIHLIKNNEDKDPLFYANTIGNPEIVELLTQAQSKKNDQAMEELSELLMEESSQNSKKEVATLGKRNLDQNDQAMEELSKLLMEESSQNSKRREQL